MQLAVKYRTRWLIRQDIEQLLNIENELSPNPWSRDDFLESLRSRNVIGIVVSDEDYCSREIYGFAIYLIDSDCLRILKLAYLSEESGSVLMDKLKSKLSAQRRTTIIFDVSENNLSLQLFLSANRFKATEVIRNYFPDADAYHFVYTLEEKKC
jgi:ribosomal protein S18 acetylase RimI-like enzyme